MPLINCPECNNKVSNIARSCPHCGFLVVEWLPPPVTKVYDSVTQKMVIDERGAWCPHCRNRDSVKITANKGCLFWIFVFISVGAALIMIPFMKVWRCSVCMHEWKA